MIEPRNITLSDGIQDRVFRVLPATRKTVRDAQEHFDALLIFADSIEPFYEKPGDTMEEKKKKEREIYKLFQSASDHVAACFHALAKRAEPDLTLDTVDEFIPMNVSDTIALVEAILQQTFLFTGESSKKDAVEDAKLTPAEKKS